MMILSHNGLVKLCEFLAANLHKKALRDLLDAWEDDVTIWEIDGQPQGHLEIRGRYTSTGNPETHVFRGEEVDEDGLTEAGLRRLCTFLAHSLSTAALRDLLHVYTSDVISDDETQTGSLTVHKLYTSTEQDEVLEFSADDLEDDGEYDGGCYTTRETALAAIAKHDFEGVVVEGKGSHDRPWLVVDPGTAEDLLSDDLDRSTVESLLEGGKHVFTLDDYRGDK